MRWDRLFDDLEGQLAAQASAELAAEVAERTRAERASITVADRLAAWLGRSCTIHAQGDVRIVGTLCEVAAQWAVVEEPFGPVLLLTASVTGVHGIGSGADRSQASGVGRRLGLGVVLRGIARDRTPVRITLVTGDVVVGTIDAVGADHLDLAEHAADVPRRMAQLRGARLVPWWSMTCVRPASPATGSRVGMSGG
ncbi:MAG: hypothetical protein ACRC35_00310 [Angustibacter sp.]